MPNLPKPRFGRPVRARSRGIPPALHEPESETPNVEIVEAPGLRWINIERPGALERAWLEEHFDFHPLDYEDINSRNQRPKVDEYDDYQFVVLHFPRFDKQVGRLNAAELDVFIGPDYVITMPNEPIQPLEYLFERCRHREDVRDALFGKGAGYLLYKIVDDCVDASFPMLRKMGNKLERLEDDIFEGHSEEIVRDISNVKQEIINFRKIVRPQRTALRDFKEVVEALESTNESVISHHVNDILRVLTSISVVVLPLTFVASIFGMNVQVPGEGDIEAFWIVTAVMVAMLLGMVWFFRHRRWL
jgi:magnesium transporter